MNRSEAAALLTLAAARDKRTIGDADVLAWAEDLADVAFVEARAALSRHFRTSEKWLMPVHIIDLVKAIRADAQRYNPHPARALPSRFEADDERAARAKAGIAACRAAIAAAEPEPDAPLDPTNPVRDRALRRARAERAAS